MNIKKTLLLAFVLVCATVYLTRVSEPGRRAAQESDTPFSEWNQKVLSSIRVEREQGGGSPYTLMAKNIDPSPTELVRASSWTLAELPGAEVDSGGINSMLSTLRGLRLVGPLDEKRVKKDFSAYGLDKPKLTLVVESGDRVKTSVDFGKKSEYLQQRYVKLSGKPGIYLVDEASFAALDKSSEDVRSKNPLAVVDSDVREITLRSSAGQIEVSQPVVSEWRIVKPTSFEASPSAISELLTTLRTSQVMEFIDGATSRLADFGLDRPEVSVAVKLRDGAPDVSYSALFGKGKDGAVYFTYEGSPSVFKASMDSIQKLTKSVSDLREKRVWKLTTREISEVVSGGGADTPVDIKVTPTDWSVNGKVSDPTFVEQLLSDIAQLEVFGFASSAPVGSFAAPFLTLEVTKKGDTAEKLNLTIGKEVVQDGERLRYARLGESGEVLLIKDIEAKRVVPHEGALIQRATPTVAPTTSN